jgi:hypothetical protein
MGNNLNLFFPQGTVMGRRNLNCLKEQLLKKFLGEKSCPQGERV